MNKNKIYLGPANTADFFRELQTSLRSVNLKADFIPWSSSQHEFYERNNKAFLIFGKPPFKIFGKNIFFFINILLLKPLYFVYALIKYNTFFFIKPTTFFKSNFDLKILKFLHKKIVFFYVGCNDRDPIFSDEPAFVCNLCFDKEKQINNNCNNLELKKQKARFFESYSTAVFGFNDNINFLQHKGIRLAIGMKNIDITTKQKKYNSRLKILHLPSNPLVKGTNFITPVLRRIEQEENVDIIIKEETWTREAIIQALKEGHIIVDSLAEYTFGKLSLEAIQYACLPLNAYPDWIAEYYDIPPVVKVDKYTLYNTLKELIADRALLQKKMEQSQSAFNKYFTYEVVGNYYKEKLNLK